jgi:cytoskeletal protein RodZ
MAGKIFISYRRDDSRYQAQRIYEAFLRALPRESIFMDVDSIPLGTNFVKVLEGWVEQCDVLLVLMGAGWVNSTDSKTGTRRLDNQKDFVRVEIRGALTRDIPVVPVLLDGAGLPEEAALPDDIKGLLYRNAEFVEYRTFDADVQRLIRKLGARESTKQGASPSIVARTQLDQATKERDHRSGAEGLGAQGDLADKPHEKKTLGEDKKSWLKSMIVATVLLAAAVIGTLVFWSPALLSGKRVEVAAKGVDSARQSQAADAETGRQAAEAKAADAEKARQAAEAKTADAEKARQAAEAKLADAENARQAAEAKLKAQQAADAKATQVAGAAQATTENTRKTAAASAPAAVTSSLFTRKTNFKAQGQSFISYTPLLASVSICEQKCERSNRCNAFSYNKTSGDCYEYAVVELVSNEDYDSGIRQQPISFVIRTGVEAIGSQLSDASIVATIGECEQKCAQTKECNVFTYSGRLGACYVYSRANFVANQACDSGVRGFPK